MPQNINCKHYRGGKCVHGAAPRRWFGKPRCILIYGHTDQRVKSGCSLQCEYPRPNEKTTPPPQMKTRNFQLIKCFGLRAEGE